MLRYTDIIKTINDKIKTKFPDVTVTSSDTVEGIKRPSFMVDLNGLKEDDFMQKYRDRNFDIKIRYFASTSKKNKVENLNVIDDLSDIFLKDRSLVVNDYRIELYEEIDVDIIDSVVHYTIPVYISEEFERIDDTSLMEELSVNI